MMDQQNAHLFMDQQYTQPFFYQDSPQGQPQVIYLQPQPMQYSYSNPTSMCEGQEALFTYSVNQPQSPAGFATMLADNEKYENAGYSFPIHSSDGSITPSVTADPSVVMGGSYLADAPTMTISPTSLQRTPINPEHSPLTSVSDTECFAPQRLDIKDATRKRRLSCEELIEARSVTGQQDPDRDQAAPVPRKRSRKDKGDCASTSSAATTPAPQSQSQNANQTWPIVDSAKDQTKAALAETLRKKLGIGKKKHAPPGGFKPWNTSPASSHLPSGSDCINPITGEVSLPNLENLTKEEIRKVKNRASAQRSRTRKSEQAFELRLENAKLMERLESLKQVLRDSRPDLCASMALDRPEPPLLSLEHVPAIGIDGLLLQEDEKSHMQMLIQGLRDQLDAERNQRVAAEQMVAKLQRQIESISSEDMATPPISPPGVVVPKMTLDQVAERENALRIVDASSEIVEPHHDLVHSLPAGAVLCKLESPPAQTRYIEPLLPSRSSGTCGRRGEEGKATVLATQAFNANLVFDFLVTMVLMAMCAAMTHVASSEASLRIQPALDTRISDAINYSIGQSAHSKQAVSLTLLRPITAEDDFGRMTTGTMSLKDDAANSAVNHLIHSWLGRSASSDSSCSLQSPPKGWIIVSSSNEKIPSPYQDKSPMDRESFNEAFAPGPNLFDTVVSRVTDLQLNMDTAAFPSLLAPAGALWQDGPSPTLAPLMVEDTFADIDYASDLSDLQSRTRASTVFDDHASSLLSSRRNSIHSTWSHNMLGMTRSASAMPTIAAVTAFEKTASTKFAKFDCEIEFSTEIVIDSARTGSTGAELLDRSQAARLLATGNALFQQ
ncbi:hypothetical protein NliqN6_0843 [Naganishia liquefaciens]|uniref:BZIP domain-containing protein n=1 Tax=Naganishia liquefaciens TaxID=104408 RepID=A0A8H3TPB2_9TREE|nr:hypothetical protein NliqN6_0843 [Naganishia liquefaciens]